MIDNFASAADTVHAPATHSFAITLSDSETLPLLPEGVYVGQAGRSPCAIPAIPPRPHGSACHPAR